MIIETFCSDSDRCSSDLFQSFTLNKFNQLLSGTNRQVQLARLKKIHVVNSSITRKQKHLKAESKNFSKCSSRDNKTCLNSFRRCCVFFTASPFYCPSNGLFITFILYSAAPVWPHYDYSTALEFQDNYELHCFNKSVGQRGSRLHLHSSHRGMLEGSAGQMESMCCR